MDDYDQQRYEAFLDELKALLERHKVTLSTSDYDYFQVWQRRDGEPVLWPDHVENRIDKKV